MDVKIKIRSKATDKSVRPTQSKPPTAGAFLGLEEVPGFAVFFVAAAAAGVAAEGVDADHKASDDGADGNEIPDIGSQDHDRDEIYFGGRVREMLAGGLPVGVDGVGAVVRGGAGFDLDAPGTFAGVHDEVVTLAFAVGFSHDQAFGAGFDHEHHFGEFAALLGG